MSTAQKLINKIATDGKFRSGLDSLSAADKPAFLQKHGFGDVSKDDIQSAIEPAIRTLSPHDLQTGGLAAADDTVTTATTTTTVFAAASAAVAAA